MSTTDPWSGRNVTRARAFVAQHLPAPCARCGLDVTGTDQWVVGHVIPRWKRPDLALVPTNWRPEHRRCSDESGGRETVAARRARAALELAVFRGGPPQDSPAPPFRSLSTRRPDPPPFDPQTLDGCPWLDDLLELPPDAAWPRHMSPPHPDAVGSYGLEAESWSRDELGVELRWWQRLATRRQLEHDREGRLVWGTVVESTPRRAGKSLRLRVVALWRMAHRELFGEPQLVVHTGRDMAIAREIHRQAWPYAERVWGAKAVSRANGKEAIESRLGDRWLVRAVSAVYGYDVTLGLVDEGWDVPSSAVDEGLEPGLLERVSPQLLLTSTAHRRATSLMRRRIAAAVSGLGEDWESLLALWTVDPGAPIGEESTWRAASPHWTDHRRRMISAKYERALRGEADPEADDPDPLEGFKAQYLNLWPPPDGARRERGDPVVEPRAWTDLAGFEPGRGMVAAVEAWFGQGASVAVAEPVAGGRVGVTVRGFPDVPTAARFAVKAAPTVLAGKSLNGDPGLVRAEFVGSTSRQAVTELRRLIDDGVLVHDGSPELADQVLAVRVVRSSDGPRLVSSGRCDAVKATVWAVGRARSSSEAPAVF